MDKFSTLADTLASQSTRCAYITPSDTTDLAEIPKTLIVIDGGDVNLVPLHQDGDAGVILPAVPGWTDLGIRPRRVLATGTTATKILALY